ncbi:InlB B-repeat-containing protein [Adlercreutzia sp. ZJ304]|uniref:InlB B-repeat-containing protein n=1 Tax=Adlercreutzia sp. ZJ304 TaxID=2709791 RepID=UPI0013EB64BE|nr:InlB B-repeat-containing protein [Adlercreutzia sp. ZJ304]
MNNAAKLTRKNKMIRFGLSALLVASCIPVVALSSIQAAEAAAALPTKLENGRFNYPILQSGTSDAFTNKNWNYLPLQNFSYDGEIWLDDVPDEDFGWDSYDIDMEWFYHKGSSTDEYGIWPSHGVRIQKSEGNQYALLFGNDGYSQSSTNYWKGYALSMEQKLATTPGTLFVWKFKHQARNATHAENVYMTIGWNNAVKQGAYRISQNVDKRGALGYVGTTMTTYCPSKTSNYAQGAYWETYQGKYLVPDGQTRTSFEISTDSSSTGSMIDDVEIVPYAPLVYNLNGGSSSSIVTNISQARASNYAGYFEEGKSHTLTSAKPTRSGYTFLGWSKTKYGDINNKATYNSIKTNIVSSVTIAAGTNTIYAVWGKNPTVSFYDGIGSALKSQTVAFGGIPTAPEIPKREGYTFVNWDKEITRTYENTQITAKWEANKYDIEFCANGGSGSMPVQHMTYDKDAELLQNLFNNSESTWQRWNTKPDGTGDTYANKESVSNLSATNGAVVKLYAQWADNCIVTFDDGWGNTLKTEPLKPGQSATPPAPPTITGYIFDSWTDGYKEVVEDSTVYAKWIPINYHITFDANSGCGQMDRQAMKYDESKPLNKCSFQRDGWIFTGWNTDMKGEGISFADAQWVNNLTDKNDDDITLFAQWTPLEYDIVFNPNEAYGDMPAQHEYFDQPDTLNYCKFTKPGNTFQGWALSKDGPIVFKDGENICNIVEEGTNTVELYAVWQENAPVLITYKAENPNQTSINNACEELLPKSGLANGAQAISNTGYKFLEWHDIAGKTISTTSKVLPERNSDGLYTAATYIAISEPIEYTIRYNANGGIGDMSCTKCVYDEPFNIASNEFSREGYEFCGWSKNRSGITNCYEPGEQTINLASNDKAVVNLYAKWKPMNAADTNTPNESELPNNPELKDEPQNTYVPDQPSDPAEKGEITDQSVDPVSLDASIDTFGDPTINTGYGQTANNGAVATSKIGETYDKTGDSSQTIVLFAILVTTIAAIGIIYGHISLKRKETW